MTGALIAEFVIASRTAQGLTETVTDPAVLARVAALLQTVDSAHRCRGAVKGGTDGAAANLLPVGVGA